MNSISAQKLKVSCQENEACLLDVRQPDEYHYRRIQGAQLIPLDSIESRASEIPKDRPVYVYCRSGNRSRQAVSRLEALGFNNLVNLEGGLQAYEKCGGQILCPRRGLPLIQQVQIGAGSLVVAGTLLAWLVHPAFMLLSGLVGTGLVFAGVSGFCGMAQLLSHMPWNREEVHP